MRCAVCGRLSSEECNVRTHQVHDRLWAEYREANRNQLLVDPKGLRQRRIDLGLTQRQVADRIGTSDFNISHWETGRHRPHQDQQLAWESSLSN